MDFVPRFVAQQRRASAGSTAAPGCAACTEVAFELQLDRRLRDAAIAWAEANPGRAVQLAGVKFLRMWNVWPNEPRLSSWPIRLVVLFTYTPLLIFAIIGAVANARPGLAVYIVLAPGRVLDAAAHGVCQFDPLPRAGDASIAGAGGGRE